MELPLHFLVRFMGWGSVCKHLSKTVVKDKEVIGLLIIVNTCNAPKFMHAYLIHMS